MFSAHITAKIENSNQNFSKLFSFHKRYNNTFSASKEIIFPLPTHISTTASLQSHANVQPYK